MIVRILAEGQYTVPSSLLDELNSLDNQLVNSVASEDEAYFRSLYGQIISLVRSQGKELPVEELHPSDVIIPSEDVSFEEARSIFVGEGLLPG
jgi:hypothetical protein